MPLLVDVHTHLTDPKMSDTDSIIQRAKDAGVKAIITNGLNKQSNRECLKLAKEYDIVKAALGLYPIEAEKVLQEEILDEIKFIKKNKKEVIAIGEIGLDLHWTRPEEIEKVKIQEFAFEKFIDLAMELDIPVIVHSRKAEKNCIEFLEKKKARKVIMHCFGGNQEEVERVIKNCWHFSIPTSIVRGKHFERIVEICPLGQLLTETDAPYLSPFKGKDNEPAYVVETIKSIARIKKMTIEDTENNIFMNYQRLFA